MACLGANGSTFPKRHLSPTDRVAGFAAVGKHCSVTVDQAGAATYHRWERYGQVRQILPTQAVGGCPLPDAEVP